MLGASKSESEQSLFLRLSRFCEKPVMKNVVVKPDYKYTIHLSVGICFKVNIFNFQTRSQTCSLTAHIGQSNVNFSFPSFGSESA